jgi:proteic killer suppression protein
MLRKFRDKRTERFAYGEFVKELSGISRQAERRLRAVEEATSLGDLATIRGYRLEQLRGDRSGQYSIRINDQWRICFEWVDDEIGAVNIEIVDYHYERSMPQRERIPIHPGEILAEDVLPDLGMNARQLGEALGVPPNRISEILRGRRSISADTALRLARWLGTSAEFWLRLQLRYDLEVAEMEHGAEIEKTVTPRVAA